MAQRKYGDMLTGDTLTGKHNFSYLLFLTIICSIC